ncbi:MAG: alpha/beta hydrolase [Pseudomonadota bacterium]|jgi:pimeloyl-ACP methyl ester carboxylesterase|nr:alpha/beta hydrolase [Xanthomonadaceae bacterium]MDE2247022.1 alpha/beta hydrolase [Xanthomonadaceae bacterium]MDE3209782.1 alpha/beta hydrolase [Pseudomonadota bacterium]
MTTERACRFGRAQHLIGIIGLPPAPAEEGRVGIVVLNAGMVHRVGPFRLHVELTRRLNACGYPSLRFDLSSIGDSGASNEPRSHEEQVRSDVADAINLLRQHAGCTRVILLGLCSGAQNAHVAACTESRVAGAIFLDGYAFRTFGFRIRHYLPRLLNAARWRRFLDRRMSPPEDDDSNIRFGVHYPPLSQVRRELAGMLERGLKLYFIYSGGISGHYNHPRQFRECYGRLAAHPGASTRLLKQADHTYVLETDRQLLFDTIETWLAGNFPTPARSSPP